MASIPMWSPAPFWSAHATVGITERALQLSEDMQRHGLHPDVVTYTVLISTCDSVV